MPIPTPPRICWLLLGALAGCASPPAGPPLRTAVRYGGAAEPPTPLEIGAARLQREERSSDILMGRYAPGDSPIALGPAGTDPVAKRAQHLAAIAQVAVRAELGIPGGLGLCIILVDDAELAARRIVAEMPSDRGLAFGVPVQKDGILPEHASAFVYNIAHQATALRLTTPEAGAGCALHRRDARVRWFGEGVASLVGVRALADAVKDGQELAPLAYVAVLEEARRRGIETVSLADWIPRGPFDGPLAAGEAFQERLRRAVAAHCAHQWYASAARRKNSRPIRELIDWLRGFPMGPTHEQLASWLVRSGGWDIAAIERVPLADVYDFHVSQWKKLRWKVPTPASEPSGSP